MAIRIVHNPSPAAVGMAAYATGVGKAQERQKKYGLDMVRDQQRLQARRQEQFEGFKYQTFIEGMRRQADQDRFDAGQAAMDARMERGREWEREDRDKEFKFREQQDAASQQAIADRQIDSALQAGELELTPYAKTEINNAQADYAKAVASNKYTPEQLSEIRKQAEEKIRNMKRVGSKRPDTQSNVDAVNSSLGSIQNGKFVPGGEATHQIIDGKLMPIPPDPAKQEATAKAEYAEQQKSALQREDQIARQKRLQTLEDKRMALESSRQFQDATPTQRKAMLKVYDDAIAKLTPQEPQETETQKKRFNAETGEIEAPATPIAVPTDTATAGQRSATGAASIGKKPSGPTPEQQKETDDVLKSLGWDGKEIKTVASATDYAGVQVGELYRGPDGQIRRKQ